MARRKEDRRKLWVKPRYACKALIIVVLNHEEGGERSVEDGDDHAETMLHEYGAVVSLPFHPK